MLVLENKFILYIQTLRRGIWMTEHIATSMNWRLMLKTHRVLSFISPWKHWVGVLLVTISGTCLPLGGVLRMHMALFINPMCHCNFTEHSYQSNSSSQVPAPEVITDCALSVLLDSL